MNYARMVEQSEAQLAPYAARDERSKRRAMPLRPDGNRNEFQRDRDRILYSSAFRRLGFKTQVFVYNRNNMHRTRLTHTLEVAQLARAIAQMLGINADLCEAISLGHDLGHAPFGHAGEWALNRLMADHGGFDHNEHSLRVVDFIEHRFPEHKGLNLAFATREGIIRHSTSYDSPKAPAEFRERSATVEAEVVNLADRIAYNIHDVEDAYREGLLDLGGFGRAIDLWRWADSRVRQRYIDLCEEDFFYRVKSEWLKRLINSAIETTQRNIDELGIQTFDDVTSPRRARALVALPHELEEGMRQVEAYLMQNVYLSPLVQKMNDKGMMLITSVFERYLKNPRTLPASFVAQYPEGTLAADPKIIVCDYIAGMTDQYLIKEYQSLFDPNYDVF